MGHQDAFLWPGPNDRYRLSQGTLAGTRGNGENAPENEPARAGGSARLGRRIFDNVMRGRA